MRVYLVGFMGAGKTTVGRFLATEAGWELVDLDARVEAAAGATATEIFATSGEAEFRRLEREHLLATGSLASAVVATGGGVYVDEANREWIARHGVAVWLHVPFDLIVGRMGAAGRSRRPLFRDRSRAEALYRQRLPAYRQADLEVRVAAGDAAQTVARRIRRRLAEGGSCAT